MQAVFFLLSSHMSKGESEVALFCTLFYCVHICLIICFCTLEYVH
jgi:hypothetical protein